MSRSLDETREYLAEKYLGKAGINGVGVSRAENAIRLYIQEDADEQALTQEIETEAAPYEVRTIRTPTAKLL